MTKNVSLTVRQGERHALIGPNGAGKTSLVHQIAGQLAPTSGRIFLRDVDITHALPEERCQLGVGRTFQKNNLFRALSMRENVRLALQARRGGWLQCLRPTSANHALLEEADEILAQVRLTDGRDRPVSSLSYGEQRQLEVALALAGQPRVLLLDEPAAGLSAAERARMVTLVRRLPADLTLVIIEHDMDLVLNLVDHVTCLHNGQVIADEPVATIRHNQRVQEIYLGVG